MPTLRMMLAQAPWAPDGDLHDHAELRACLTPQGRLDAEACEAAPDPWVLTRHQPGQPVRAMRLAPLDGRWGLRSLRDDDEPLWTLDADTLRPGEIVTLRQPDGAELLFRVVAIDPD